MWSLVHPLQDVSSRAVALERTIDFGKSKREITDRDLQDDLEELRAQKEKFNELFEEMICTSPEVLDEIQDKIKKLAEKVSLHFSAGRQKMS